MKIKSLNTLISITSIPLRTYFCNLKKESTRPKVSKETALNYKFLKD